MGKSWKMAKRFSFELYQGLTSLFNFYEIWHESSILGREQNLFLGFLILGPIFPILAIIAQFCPQIEQDSAIMAKIGKIGRNIKNPRNKF